MDKYIADPHFGHPFMAKRRGFDSVEEMDKKIITDWNEAVGKNDDVYIVGDLIYKSKNSPDFYFNQLNGRLHLLKGNHDEWLLKDPKIRKRFESIDDMLPLQDGKYQLFLCHYPLAEWPGFFRGVIHLYGHIHNNEDNLSNKMMKNIQNAYNVGIDYIGRPRTIEEIIKGEF